MLHTAKSLKAVYDEAKQIIKDLNPCQWDHEAHTCIAMREGWDKNGCCEGCKNLSAQGCTVEAPWCSVWLCWGVRSKTQAGKLAGQKLDSLKKTSGITESMTFFRNSIPEILRMQGR